MAATQAGLRAALAVSALLPEERRWLESRLSETERGALKRALARIDGQPLGRAADMAQAPLAAAASEDDAHWLSSHVPQLLQAMAAEPMWMQAPIGGALGEALRSQVLQALAESDAWQGKADSLRRCWAGQLPHPAPALRRGILRQLASQAGRQLKAEPVLKPASTKTGLWAWLRESLHG